MDIEKVSFSQWVADRISSAASLLEFYFRLEQFQLRAEKNTISTNEFSTFVSDFLGDRFFDAHAQKLLRETIMLYPDRLYWRILIVYLNKTHDEELARFYVDRFFSLKPLNLEKDARTWEEIQWRIKSAYAAVSVLAQDQLPAFCEMVLKMFPNLPWGNVPGKGGLRGLLIKTRDEKAPKDPPVPGRIFLISRDKSGKTQIVDRRPIAMGH